MLEHNNHMIEEETINDVALWLLVYVESESDCVKNNKQNNKESMDTAV